MSLSFAQESAAAQALASLGGSLAAAWKEVSSSSGFFNGTIRAAVLANLEVDRVQIGRLGGELLGQARAGKLEFSRWVVIATNTHEDIAFQRGTTKGWSLSGILNAAARETYSTVVGGVTKTVESVGGGFGIGAIAGVLVVLFIAWKLK